MLMRYAVSGAIVIVHGITRAAAADDCDGLRQAA